MHEHKKQAHTFTVSQTGRQEHSKVVYTFTTDRNETYTRTQAQAHTHTPFGNHLNNFVFLETRT